MTYVLWRNRCPWLTCLGNASALPNLDECSHQSKKWSIGQILYFRAYHWVQRENLVEQPTAVTLTFTHNKVAICGCLSAQFVDFLGVKWGWRRPGFWGTFVLRSLERGQFIISVIKFIVLILKWSFKCASRLLTYVLQHTSLLFVVDSGK
jgi:hypothetical protein